ncbi:4Fe-4S ferredoxin [candidate division WOR-3 bacterium]|nr:4Fe-4S ferredoxin [candidate division WOR-3 bacterium]
MVIGFRRGNGGRAEPAFITRPEDADQLIFDETCGPNLANHLLKVKHLGRLAVVAKGCDSRSLLILLKEKQLDRKDLHVLGVGCSGVTEDGRLSDSCTTCVRHSPVVYDEMVGDPATEIPRKQDDRGDLDRFEALPAEGRWQELSEDVSRCIRCYACRQVCPNCYCPVCFVDNSLPQWVGRTAAPSDNMVFHIMRALHMAGRCVECGACARACPVGIDLMKFNRKVARIVKSRFGATAGMDADEPPALASFRSDDQQEFIR